MNIPPLKEYWAKQKDKLLCNNYDRHQIWQYVQYGSFTWFPDVKILRKITVSTQEIRWNYGILRSVIIPFKLYSKIEMYGQLSILYTKHLYKYLQKKSPIRYG